MAKLSLAVAALLVASVAGTRVQAQSEQFIANEQYAFVQGDPVQTAGGDEAPAVVSSTLPSAFAPAARIVEVAPVAVDATAPTGPSADAATLSPRFSSNSNFGTQSMRRPSRGSGVGLMIFGGAALITGLIIGDNAGTVIAVAGAIVGLYGLYVYLGRPTGMGNDGQASRSERIGLGYKLKTNF